jgi:hypothetical protein
LRNWGVWKHHRQLKIDLKKRIGEGRERFTTPHGEGTVYAKTPLSIYLFSRHI